MNKNPNCDGAHCTLTRGELRRVPHVGSQSIGADILCHSCYMYEMRYRRQENLNRRRDDKRPIPRWEDLEVYDG